MKDEKVAIIGGGPSAMYAVLACNLKGIIPDVYIDSPNIPLGALWLKFVPLWLTQDFASRNIEISSVGERKFYIEKQWEEYPKDYQSSFPKIAFHEHGFDPGILIPSILLNRDRCKIISISKRFKDYDLVNLLKDGYAWVFHSFPTEEAKDHYAKFVVERMMIYYHENLGQMSEAERSLNDYSIYDGNPASIVVRESRLFGKKFFELEANPPKKEVERLLSLNEKAKIIKFKDISPSIIHVGSFILNDRIIPIGRYATFVRDSLAHHTFSSVREFLESS